MNDPRELTDVHQVRQRIAHALLPTRSATSVGDVTLLPHQQSAVARLRRILAQHHGALLADDVGLGKTFVALAVAHSYAHVHVLAPAGLRDMWRSAITRAGPTHAHVHSLHAYSRSAATPLFGRSSTLVIVDEAHYLRNAHTARYRAVAHAVAGCDVLLLSATPLHNRARELQTLFALFRGDRADSLTPVQLGALIVRRTSAVMGPVPRPIEKMHTPRDASQRPTLREHAPLRMPQDRETLTHILALPAPLPAHDGAVAGALIRLGLLRAWCSSDAALAHALRVRQLRGAALHDALRAGRHPTQQELRTWVVGEYEAQLAFPELLAQQPVESGPLLEILQRHLDAVAALARHHGQHARADSLRADTLRHLLEQHPSTPIVAFSQFTRTIAALQRALADIAGVGVVTSRTGRIASGPLPRAEVLASFAPVAHGRPPPPPHLRIRLLLATDLIAEGVNLQDAGVVVHLDLPWTDALRTQRVGRCARLGSPHATVHVYRLAPARFAETALRLEQRLARKHALSRAVIGSADHLRPAHSAAERASAFDELLQTWNDAVPEHRRAAPVALAAVRHAELAALVLIGRGDTQRLVAIRHERKWWRERQGLGAVIPLMRAVDAAVERHETLSASVAREQWRVHRHGLRHALRRGWRREQAQTITGGAAHAMTDARQGCVRTIQRVVRALSTAERHLVHRELLAARLCIERAIGAGYDARLQQWRADAPAEADPAAVRRWLSAWRQDPLLARLAERSPASPGPTAADRARAPIRAVLLLVPD